MQSIENGFGRRPPDLPPQKLVHSLRAITFDLWGTLIDDGYQPPGALSISEKRREFFRRKLAECGVHIDTKAAEKAYARARQVFDDMWRRQLPLDTQFALREMLAVVQAEISQTAQQEIIRYFEEGINETTLQLYPGTAAALQRLHGKYRIGLISDTAWIPGRILREQLQRHDILQYFDALLFSDEAGCTKPHPAIFAAALRQLDVAPQQCLHVGDLPFTDIKGACRAGMCAAWIRKPGLEADETLKKYPPHLIANSVAEVAEILLQE